MAADAPFATRTPRSTTTPLPLQTPRPTTTNLCLTSSTHILISKNTIIATLTTSGILTLLSLLLALLLLYRSYTRRRLLREAKAWGRKSRYQHRISVARKEIDTQYSRQFSGCLVHGPENPEMGSESPVEMGWEERVWEVPAVPATAVGGARREGKVVSLVFDEGHGLWLPRR